MFDKKQKQKHIDLPINRFLQIEGDSRQKYLILESVCNLKTERACQVIRKDTHEK